MSAVKLAIVFYSTYATNLEMARIAAEAAKATGAEVRLLRVAETAPEAVVNGQDAWKATLDKMGWSGWLVIERSRDAARPTDVKYNFTANAAYLKRVFQ